TRVAGAGAIADGRSMGGDADSSRRTDRSSRFADPACCSGKRSHPPGRTAASAKSWRRLRALGEATGYVVFGGRKICLERPRVRTRQGQEVELESYGQLQRDGKLQRAVQEGVVAGLSTRNYRRAVEPYVHRISGYAIRPPRHQLHG